jgi:hypothetical protein
MHDVGPSVDPGRSAAMNVGLIVIGDKLRLYQALVEAGPLRTDQLAARTGAAERYVRQWIRAQAGEKGYGKRLCYQASPVSGGPVKRR